MRNNVKKRTFTPTLTALESRRLMALAAAWIGQDGGDLAGTEGLVNPQRPNDYQDIHIRLSGLSASSSVAHIAITKPVRGGWTWDAAGGWSNAVFLLDAAPGSGDLYMEPDAADPAGTLYEAIRVDYADGSSETTSMRTGTAVDPNLRTAGEHVVAAFMGQGGQDWTGPTIGVGPDGYQDVRIALSNLSAAAAAHVTITAATNPPRVWETGTNPDGRWNAELLDRPGANGTLGTTADVFFSSDVNLAGVPLTVTVTYEHQNPDGSYTNRSGKTDAVVILAGPTNPTLAMPVVAEANLPRVSATSLPQDATSPGYSHAALDASSLAATGAPRTFASVRSAVLSNQYGSSWVYVGPNAASPYTGGSSPMSMRYDATTGIFDFAPVRDESGSMLTLVLTFADGGQAVARFAGAASDVNLRVADTRLGAGVVDVSAAADLLAALQAHAPNIHLAAGSYTLYQPLSLGYPVRITADPGAVVTFALSNAPGSSWNGASGAILVSASHVALDGFAIRFRGVSTLWAAGNRAIVQAGLGSSDVDLSFTNLDVFGPAAAVASGFEDAVPLMNFDPGDSGVIANNLLKGGWIQLGTGPWRVTGNDYQGAVPNTITPTFLNVYTSHDLTISGNHAHASAPAGITQRFVVFGNADKGQGIGNVIEGNTIDGGIGTPTGVDLPPGYGNNPEIILLETYQPRFEGKPSSISHDGSIVQIPYLRGPSARTGDVISIVTGPHAGEWRMIAQALSPTRYLLDEPLPAGDYVITIGRGFVNQVYRGNTIDVRDMASNTVGLVISGNDWGSQIVGNAFLGGEALRIGAGSNEGAFEGPYGAPWGWSRLPVLGLAIDGNLFVDAAVSLSVAHDRLYNKSSGGRTYLAGDVSNNEIRWTGAGPAVTIGTAGYTQAAFPWLTLDEIRLAMDDDWGGDPTTGAAATVQVFAATINGEGTSGQTITLPFASDDGGGEGVPTEWVDASGARWVQAPASVSALQVFTRFKVVRAEGPTSMGWLLVGSTDGESWTVLNVRPDVAGADSSTAATPPAVPAVDLARDKPATSSTVEGSSYVPGKAVDGDDSSRWSSGQWMQTGDVGWLAVDLGAVYAIDRITLNWEAAFAVDYQIQVSDDGADWTTIRSIVGNASAGVLDYTDLSASGRYVRIYCTRVNATKNYSLYDLNVYGA